MNVIKTKSIVNELKCIHINEQCNIVSNNIKNTLCMKKHKDIIYNNNSNNNVNNKINNKIYRPYLQFDFGIHHNNIPKIVGKINDITPMMDANTNTSLQPMEIDQQMQSLLQPEGGGE